MFSLGAEWSRERVPDLIYLYTTRVALCDTVLIGHTVIYRYLGLGRAKEQIVAMVASRRTERQQLPT